MDGNRRRRVAVDGNVRSAWQGMAWHGLDTQCRLPKDQKVLHENAPKEEGKGGGGDWEGDTQILDKAPTY